MTHPVLVDERRRELAILAALEYQFQQEDEALQVTAPRAPGRALPGVHVSIHGSAIQRTNTHHDTRVVIR